MGEILAAVFFFVFFLKTTKSLIPVCPSLFHVACELKNEKAILKAIHTMYYGQEKRGKVLMMVNCYLFMGESQYLSV